MDEKMDLLATEQNNPNTLQIDQCSTLEMMELINQADQMVPKAVSRELASIAKAVDCIAERLGQGGRLLYVGAGTSGRLGVLDASECVPTYGTPPEMVVGLIAGGERALVEAVEGIEDSTESGIADIVKNRVNQKDAVVGIAASGRTPYVLAALKEAAARGALTVGVCNTANSELSKMADIAIEVITGPEVIMGSTRMKAGTAQKMVLNMISTGTMIKLGRVYQNCMVDLIASNHKLQARAVRIIRLITGAEQDAAEEALAQADGQIKTAILMLQAGMTLEQAGAALSQCGGVLRAALEAVQK